MRTHKHIKTSFIAWLFLFLLSLNIVSVVTVSAQSQTFDPSGSSPEAFQCFDNSGVLIKDPSNPDKPLVPKFDSTTGTYFCIDPKTGSKVQAYRRPLTLQQLEIWFVRLLYVVWGLIASLSFLMVVKLGYDYILTRGDVTKITAIRQRIINFIIGFALVFLAVPILSTVFRLLGINRDIDCYNVNMPGFQFFYNDLCTDPNSYSNPCVGNMGDAIGKICTTPGANSGCYFGSTFVTYRCISDTNSPLYRTWQY